MVGGQKGDRDCGARSRRTRPAEAPRRYSASTTRSRREGAAREADDLVARLQPRDGGADPDHRGPRIPVRASGRRNRPPASRRAGSTGPTSRRGNRGRSRRLRSRPRSRRGPCARVTARPHVEPPFRALFQPSGRTSDSVGLTAGRQAREAHRLGRRRRRSGNRFPRCPTRRSSQASAAADVASTISTLRKSMRRELVGERPDEPDRAPPPENRKPATHEEFRLRLGEREGEVAERKAGGGDSARGVGARSPVSQTSMRACRSSDGSLGAPNASRRSAPCGEAERVGPAPRILTGRGG